MWPCATKCGQMWPGVSRHERCDLTCKLLPSVTRWYRVWTDKTKCYQMWPHMKGVTRCDQMLAELSKQGRCDQVWPDVTRYDLTLKVWLDVIRCDNVWPDLTRYEQGWSHKNKCDQMWLAAKNPVGHIENFLLFWKNSIIQYLLIIR